MIKQFISGIVLLSLLAVIPPQAQAQNTRRLHIVASFSILADVVRNVVGDSADVETLIPIGVDPHTFEPSAQDVVKLSDADVVFVTGLNFEGGLSKVLDEAAGDKVVAVSGCVPVREVSSEMLDVHTEGDTHPDESGSGDTGGERILYQLGNPEETCPAHHRLVEGIFGASVPETNGVLGMVYEDVCQDTPCDPHVWTDPVNVALWALMISDTLAQLNPDNPGPYIENALAYVSALAALDHDIAAQIDTIPSERRVIVTNHAALNYFAARYGLQVVGVVIPGGSTVAEPSVDDVLKLIQTVQDYHVPVIFTESTAREDLARQIADETGAQIVRLYEGSLSEPDGPAATYLDYMRFMTTTMVQALK